MNLKICKNAGYDGNGEPVAGDVIKAFNGNQKKASADAKKWLSQNSEVVKGFFPIWVWEN